MEHLNPNKARPRRGPRVVVLAKSAWRQGGRASSPNWRRAECGSFRSGNRNPERPGTSNPSLLRQTAVGRRCLRVYRAEGVHDDGPSPMTAAQVAGEGRYMLAAGVREHGAKRHLSRESGLELVSVPTIASNVNVGVPVLRGDAAAGWEPNVHARLRWTDHDPVESDGHSIGYLRSC